MTTPVQYGPLITTIIIYFYVGQFLCKKRTAQALAELFGTPVSQGIVVAITGRAADGLGVPLEWTRANRAPAEVADFDEPGLRVSGQLRWVRSALIRPRSAGRPPA